jgi:predicted tellurium resistance membrane protein TerC
MTGTLVAPDLRVDIAGDTVPLTPEPGLKITFQHEKAGGLLAALIGLLTLTVMEIVLGIDNVIFLAIVAGKLPVAQQPLARRIGLGAALGTRLLLLCTLTFLLGLTRPLFDLPELPFLQDPEARGVSWRDLILLVGGLFLVAKSVKEIHEKIAEARDGGHGEADGPKKAAGFVSVIIQIAVIDIIFSLDSVITAVGMVEKDQLWVMITAVVLAVMVMLAFAEPISKFVDKHPTIKLLALSFLILIGVLLLAEGLGQHVDKGYVYFAMGFAVVMELLNMRLRPKPKAKPASPPAGEGI